MSSRSETELKKLKLAELKKMCSDLAMSVTGTKSDLVDRILCNDDKKPIVTVQPDEEAKLLDDDDDLVVDSPAVGTESLDETGNGSTESEDNELVSQTEAPVIKIGQKRSATEDDDEEEIRPSKLATIDFSTEETSAPTATAVLKMTQDERIAARAQRFGAAGDGTITNVAAPAATTAGRVLDEGKKFDRARRFGLPIEMTSPKSDEEKRKARSQRFVGENAVSAPANNGSTKSANSAAAATTTITDEEAEQKRKRLEKFGPIEAMKTPPANAAEMDKKKAARAARFGVPTTPAPAVTTTTSNSKFSAIPIEVGGGDDKMKKRADRFRLNN